MRRAQAGDVILLVSEEDHRTLIRTLQPGRRIETHRGSLLHDDLIGRPLGSVVRTHLGRAYYLLMPTTDELVRNVRRRSQIIFPKDAGYIIMKLGVRPGSVVVEAGTGSGGMCLALACAAGETGRVISYDEREDMQRLARQNMRWASLGDQVTFKCRDIRAGFDETDADALFLDLPAPWEVLDQTRKALRGSGMLGCLVPTINQLGRLIDELATHPEFGFVEAEELILRPYQTIPARVRPEDHIVGHTGYLIFARAVIPLPDGEDGGTGQRQETMT